MSLDTPQRPGDSQLVIEPLRDVNLREVDESTLMATGSQDVIYTIRLNGDLTYQNLSLQTFEGLYLSMMVKFNKRWADIMPLLHS
jgi:hypothetical protein